MQRLIHLINRDGQVCGVDGDDGPDEVSLAKPSTPSILNDSFCFPIMTRLVTSFKIPVHYFRSRIATKHLAVKI
jgi:hypothetical protein